MYHGERLNSFTHLSGGVVTILGVGLLLAAAMHGGSGALALGCGIYGAAMLGMFFASAAYHSVRGPRKALLRKIDHIAIFVMIAGTYTPFCLGPLREGTGPALLAAVWGLTAVGAALEFALAHRTRLPSFFLYFGMAFLATAALPGLERGLAHAAMLWIKAGFLLYGVGFLFYVLDKKFRERHLHGIWHLFVIAAAFCHYVSVYGYVV